MRVNLYVTIGLQNSNKFKSVFQNEEKHWLLELQQEQSRSFLSVCILCCHTSLDSDIDTVYFAYLFIHDIGFIALVKTFVTYV